MFEEMSASAAQLLAVMFFLILLFFLVFGALWMRVARRATYSRIAHVLKSLVNYDSSDGNAIEKD